MTPAIKRKKRFKAKLEARSVIQFRTEDELKRDFEKALLVAGNITMTDFFVDCMKKYIDGKK